MNLRRIFANAIARRVAYVVVGLFVAFLVQVFQPARAAHCGVPDRNTAGAAAGISTTYEYEGQALAACQSMGKWHGNVSGGNAPHYDPQGCQAVTSPPLNRFQMHGDSGGQHVRSSCSVYNQELARTDVATGWTWSNPGCPPGISINPDGTCGPECKFDDPPLSSGHVQCTGVDFSSCPRTVCSGGCGYDQPGGGLDGFVIDGQRWVVTTGWMPRGQGCSVGSTPGLGTPPSDSDGDGTSDGNDGSPNNPGSGGGGDEGGLGQPEDGSSACGGPGQPACAEDGSNEGSGKGNTSGGGGNCQTPPSSTGDAILAQIAYQAWATRCAVEGQGDGGTGTGPGTGDGDGAKEGTLKGIKDWLDGNGEGVPDADDPWMDGLPGEQSDWNLGLGGGSCPAPVSTSIELGGISAPIEFSFQPMCDLAGLLNTLFKALGALIAAYIIAGVRR